MVKPVDRRGRLVSARSLQMSNHYISESLSTRIDPKLQASRSEPQLVIKRVCSNAESERKLTRT